MTPNDQIHTNSADLACAAYDCQVSMAGLTNVSFTAMNWLGVLLVYGLGLILVASVLNVTKKAREQLDEHDANLLEGLDSMKHPRHTAAE